MLDVVSHMGELSLAMESTNDNSDDVRRVRGLLELVERAWPANEPNFSAQETRDQEAYDTDVEGNMSLDHISVSSDDNSSVHSVSSLSNASPANNREHLHTEYLHARNINAADIHANDVTADDIQARDLHTNDLQANDLNVHDIRANDIQARIMNTNEIHANDIDAHVVNASVIYASSVNAQVINGKIQSTRGAPSGRSHPRPQPQPQAHTFIQNGPNGVLRHFFHSIGDGQRRSEVPPQRRRQRHGSGRSTNSRRNGSQLPTKTKSEDNDSSAIQASNAQESKHKRALEDEGDSARSKLPKTEEGRTTLPFRPASGPVYTQPAAQPRAGGHVHFAGQHNNQATVEDDKDEEL